jgi:hypothetical protein
MDAAVDVLAAILSWLGGVVVGAFELIAKTPELFGQQLIVQAILNAITALIIWYFVNRVLRGNEQRRLQREFDRDLSGLWPKIAQTHGRVLSLLLSVRQMVGRWYRTRLSELATLLAGARVELDGEIARYRVLFEERKLTGAVLAYKSSLDNVIDAIREVQASEQDPAHGPPVVTQALAFSKQAITSLEAALTKMNDALVALAEQLRADPAAADVLLNAKWMPADFSAIREALLFPLEQRSE